MSDKRYDVRGLRLKHVRGTVPPKCCEFQTYECTIPMPILGRVQAVDLCVSDIVAALNAGNIQTINSCCGHGKRDGWIALEDGRDITIIVTDRANV